MRHERKRTALALAVLSLLLPPVFGRQWFVAVSGGVGARGASSCATYADKETGMALVPGVTFEKGTEQSEVTNLMLAFGVKRADGFASEAPPHAVRPDDFHLERREVTNGRAAESAGERPGRGEARRAAVGVAWKSLELERVVGEELKETRTPGAAVAVVSGGRVVFSKGFGVASAETNAPVTTDMLFRLGSTTKMFTGAAAVVLAGQGRVRLDAPIGEYAKGLAPRLSRLTLHGLLSNSAGVADFGAPFVSHDDSALATMARAWKDEDALFGEPGAVYSYSSPGFWLAGHVIEEAAGRPYADAMEALVFAPAGMRRTTLRPLTAMTYPLAAGHAPQAGGGQPAVVRPAFNNVAMWPAGSIYSTAEDMTRWALALMSGGKTGGGRALPADLFERLSGRHVTMPGAPEAHYGYGLLSFESRGVRLFMHGGFSRGYGSMLQLAPEHGFAVVVLTNRSGETLRRSTEKAQELFLPLKPAEPPAAKKALPVTDADVRRLAGRYVNGPQVWEVYAREGRLHLKEGAADTALTRTGDYRLSFGDSLESDVAFVPGPDGRAEYVFTGLYSGRRAPASE